MVRDLQKRRGEAAVQRPWNPILFSFVRSGMKPFVVLVALSLALAGCGSAERDGPAGGGSASPAPEDPVSHTPDPNASIPSPTASLVTPKPGQSGVRKVTWESYEKLGPRTLEITYWSGVEPCYVLDRTEVRYDEERIRVTLFEGHTEMDEDVACIEIAFQKAVRVELEEPVGGRKVVDGAASSQPTQ